MSVSCSAHKAWIFTLSLLVSGLVACGGKDKSPEGPAAQPAAEANPGEAAAPSPAETPSPDKAAAPAASPGDEAAPGAVPKEYNYKVRDDHPKTEEALLKAIAESVRVRDIDRMRTFTSPEATADLERIYAGDRKGFWMRADVLKDDIGSGVTIAHRGDDTKPSWKVLVKFGNGVEETMTFTRVDGHIKIDVF